MTGNKPHITLWWGPKHRILCTPEDYANGLDVSGLTPVTVTVWQLQTVHYIVRVCVTKMAPVPPSSSTGTKWLKLCSSWNLAPSPLIEVPIREVGSHKSLTRAPPALGCTNSKSLQERASKPRRTQPWKHRTLFTRWGPGPVTLVHNRAPMLDPQLDDIVRFHAQLLRGGPGSQFLPFKEKGDLAPLQPLSLLILLHEHF